MIFGRGVLFLFLLLLFPILLPSIFVVFLFCFYVMAQGGKAGSTYSFVRAWSWISMDSVLVELIHGCRSLCLVANA